METSHDKSLAMLLREYLDHRRSLNHSPLSCRVCRNNSRRFLDWLDETLEITTVDRLRADHLRRWQSQLVEQTGCHGLPLKPRTVNKNIESVRTFIVWLVERGYVSRQLPSGLEYVKTPRVLPSSVLNHAQVKQMLNHIDMTSPAGYRDRTLLELLYSAGLRSAEILGLNLPDLDLVNRTAIVTGKGNKQRVVPIGESALRHLETYLVAIRPQLSRADGEQHAVFLNDQGRRYPYHTLNRLVARVAEVLDVNFPVTPHTFRRSCTTEMIRGGANIYHVKELLGHDSLETLKHYTRLTITDLQKTHAKCHPREKEER